MGIIETVGVLDEDVVEVVEVDTEVDETGADVLDEISNRRIELVAEVLAEMVETPDRMLEVDVVDLVLDEDRLPTLFLYKLSRLLPPHFSALLPGQEKLQSLSLVTTLPA